MNPKQYAINVADLTRFAQQGPLSPVMLLVRPVMTKNIVQAEGRRWDGDAAVLDCPDERALAIVEIIRRKIPKHQLRIYHGAGRTWKRV